MWDHENLMRFNKAKCKVLHLDQENPTYMQSCIQAWDSQQKKDVELVGQIQRRAGQMTGELEHLSCGKKAEGAGLVRHGEGKALGRPHCGISVLEGSLQQEGGEAQVAQRSCGCPIPGGVQGPVRWGSVHPNLVNGDPSYSSKVGTGWSLRCLPV